jgi:hypothetical protein
MFHVAPSKHECAQAPDRKLAEASQKMPFPMHGLQDLLLSRNKFLPVELRKRTDVLHRGHSCTISEGMHKSVLWKESQDEVYYGEN